MSREQRRQARDVLSQAAIANGGYLTEYMATRSPEGREQAEADLVQVFTSEEGLRVLNLMRIAVSLRCDPLGADDRALRETNAIRNFVAELTRIATNDREPA